MWTCPICDEWVLRHRLCGDCDKIRQLCKIYTKERLLEVLDKTLVIQQMRPQRKAIKSVGDETHEIVGGC